MDMTSSSLILVVLFVLWLVAVALTTGGFKVRTNHTHHNRKESPRIRRFQAR